MISRSARGDTTIFSQVPAQDNKSYSSPKITKINVSERKIPSYVLLVSYKPYLQAVLELNGETLELITVVENLGYIKLRHIHHRIGLRINPPWFPPETY